MKRILAVDDEEPMLLCFERVLKREGYGVATANSAEKALDILSREEFDLITLDVRMPKMNGFELYELIRKKHKPVAVLFITAYPASFSQKTESIATMWNERFSDGNTDILYKPFDIATLTEKVVALIGPA